MSAEKKSTTIPSGEASFRAAVQETPTAKDSVNDVDQDMPSVEVPSSSAAVQPTPTTDHTTPSVKKPIQLPFKDYQGFFEFLTSQCNRSDTTYSSFEFSKDKKTKYEYIKHKWVKLWKSIEEKGIAT